jgi:arsenite-transporting ATPase
MSPAEVCSLAATCPAVAPRIDLAEPVHGHITLELSSAAQIMFFAGKGGVGKTTMACAAACEMASAGIGKVLLVSVDPAHSVADCIDQPLDATARQIAPNLFAMELDAASEFQVLKDEYQQELEVMLQNILGGASLAFDEDAMRSLLDLAPPGIDEVMAIVKIIDLLAHHDFDKVVIDTAPTGHLLRLLELPHLATQWLDATFKLLLKYKSMIRLPKVTKRLVELSKGVKRLSAMLTDPAQSAIVPVAIPTKLALDETGDLIRACTGKAAPAPTVNLGGTPAPAPEPIRVYIPGIIVNQISTPPEGEPGDPLLTALIRRETAMVERFRTLAGATPLALVSRHGPPRGLDRLSVLGHQLFTVSTRSPVRQ